MNPIASDLLQQMDEFLSRPNQIWLLGAGISCGAGIPLMNTLTKRVQELVIANDRYKSIYENLRSDLPTNSHIEHLLSHLSDHAAIARRNKNQSTTLAGTDVLLTQLEELHAEILGHIAEIVRWGYKERSDQAGALIGSYKEPIVEIGDHLAFIRALIGKRQDGLKERRRPVQLFTTNYDTLLEDALALSGYRYWDGFAGGAIAFRTHRYGDRGSEVPADAHLIKLHGSIDWCLGEAGKIWRVRDHDTYPTLKNRVLIYPQSTKNLETQRDPFAAQFDIFRHALTQTAECVLGICGYSFGDEHINQEIHLSLTSHDNKTTLLAFCRESDGLPKVLDDWRKEAWGNRVYIITQSGLYAGANGPICEPAAGSEHDWWTFTGLTKFLSDGTAGSCDAKI